jgi:Ca2+-binding RTX toxin-like protein
MTVVSDSTQLLAALAVAAPGDIIELAPGNFGIVVLDGIRFPSTVTIRSLDPLSPATFDTLSIKNSSFLALDHIAVTHPLATGEPDWSSALRIDKSDHISILNSEISGSADGNHTNDGQGLLVLDSSHISIAGNNFHDLKTGVSVGRSEYVDVRDNTFIDIRSDGADLANVRHVVVDGNTFTNFHPAFALGDHPDMIQVWNDGSFGDMSDIVISNNTLSQGSGGNVQSIFIQGAVAAADGSIPPPAHDIVVEGNTIDSGAAQGIWLSQVDHAHVAHNVLTIATGGASIPTIRTDHTTNTTVDLNTAPQIDDVGSVGLTYSGNTITAGAVPGSTIQGTSGADVLNGSAGNDLMLAAAGDDTLNGAAGNDRINGEDGNDFLSGGDGNDALNGGAGNDELHGGDGNDGFYGGGGIDRIFGENGNDVLFGDGGNDMLNGGAGMDELHGGSGNDGFFGGGGDDRIYGDAGVDTIYGDGGNDIIDAGADNDLVRGGAGADTFVFGLGSGSDQILDYQSGLDKLDFSSLATVESMQDLAIVATSVTSVSIQYFDGNAQVEVGLVSTSPFVLTASDFLF